MTTGALGVIRCMRLPWKHAQGSDNAELRRRLTPEQYRVTQTGGTERPYSGRYHDATVDGTYRCIVCDAELFNSDTKFDSGTGWPSFTDAIGTTNVSLHKDRKFGILRVEVRCAGCTAHLGHVFPDGPSASGERFCMNSASLLLDPATNV
jgi:peptide-methionine (R)-S-oxide reductase